MFSGIVEALTPIIKIESEQGNKHFTLCNPFKDGTTIDQSIAHNGVCLTVVKTNDQMVNGEMVNVYTVTAMQETLNRTNLGVLKEGDYVNLERAMQLGDRLDGHIVQGHVDQTAVCTEVKETDGSWYFRFEYETTPEMIKRGYFCVDKGSVTINGVSLTVCDPDIQGNKGFVSVCIIPYTYENTNFKFIQPGTIVNLEFDIIGKYLARYNTYGQKELNYDEFKQGIDFVMKASQQAKEEGEKFLAQNAKRPEVKTTPSGLQYEVIEATLGQKPAATDTVRVHYEGTLIDGTVFDSSYKRGESISFPLNGVIKGWTEGLQLMSVGSKYKLYIPYDLAYGAQGAGGSIPPYAALIFTVELLGIEK